MFLLVVTCTQLIYIESYPPLACVGFCTLHMFVYVVLSYMMVCTPCTCVLVLSLYCILCVSYLAILRDEWFIQFWGSDVLWSPHNPKMCVHEEYHLVLILRLSSLYVVCMLMRNSNSIMSINHLLLDFIFLLLNFWCYHIMGEYYALCILQTKKM